MRIHLLNFLLLCNKPDSGSSANTIIDHISAFERYSEHRVWTLSCVGDLPQALELFRFDGVIIHYSLSLLNNYYLSRKAKDKLRQFTGLKIVFVQDEYRAINRLIQEMNFLEIDILFTCFPDAEINKIYPQELLPKVSKYTNLTGYVPERLLAKKDFQAMADRRLDVGYRARKLPFWYGELGYEKWNIVEQWREKINDPTLKVDISYQEQDRIYGEDWIRFLSSCKTTLGVESGASVMDFTGDIERQVDWYQVTHPKASFSEVQERFFKEQEGLYTLNQISPRCFEAIALKTVLVLYEGEYSGILKPWQHYIPLKKDFSNRDEVLSAIKDPLLLETMAETAYQEIALNPAWHYKTWIESVDKVINHEFSARNKQQVTQTYTEEAYFEHSAQTSYSQRGFRKILFVYYKLPSSVRLLLRNVLRLGRQ